MPDQIASPAAVAPAAESVGGWHLNLDTAGIWWSPALYAVCGVDPATFTPTLETLASLGESFDLERLRDGMATLRRLPAPFSARHLIRRPDGELREVESEGWVIPGADGETRQMMGVARDLTASAALRRGRERVTAQLAAILRASGDGICGTDAAGRVTFTNPALHTLMRREGQELGGLLLHDLVHRDPEGGESHPLRECPFAGASQGPASASDPGFHRGDGSWLMVGYVRVELARTDDEPPGLVISFRDLTARQAAARLLQMTLRQVQTLSAQRGALLGHLAQAEERERTRIASEIHDDTIQALNAVALRLSNTGEQLAGDRERDLVIDAELEVRGVAERLRRLMFELLPPLPGRDLRDAVETYGSVLFSGSEMVYAVLGEVSGPVSDNHLVAYRLIQEALRNALAHSGGTRVEIDLQETDCELVVRVSDDGVGMSDRETPPTHAGLRILRRRAQAAEGSAEFATGLDGRGIALVLRLPIDRGSGA